MELKEGCTFIRTFSVIILTFLLVTTQVSASESTVSSRSDFENLVINKKLERFLISLSVTSDGKIKGSAAGRNVSGDWDWMDGYFFKFMIRAQNSKIDFYLNYDPEGGMIFTRIFYI